MLQHHRPLTYDEKKAAEAAFRGSPLDPTWSKAARNIYEGLCAAQANLQRKPLWDIQSSQPLPSKKMPRQYVLQPTKPLIQEKPEGYPFPSCSP